ncbi:hypothetical protein SAMN05216404_1338, partial [Nitrosospira multiformis]
MTTRLWINPCDAIRAASSLMPVPLFLVDVQGRDDKVFNRNAGNSSFNGLDG